MESKCVRQRGVRLAGPLISGNGSCCTYAAGQNGH